MARFLNVFLLFLALFHWSCTASAFSILVRQAQDAGYSVCAKKCFDPGVNASNCPFDTTGTRNACLCTSDTFLTNFMVCTFRTCGGEELADAASLAATNCLTTNTPSIYNESQLVTIGQSGEAPSTTTVSGPTSKSPSTATTSSAAATSFAATSTLSSSTTADPTTSTPSKTSDTISGTTATHTSSTSNTSANSSSTPASSGKPNVPVIVGVVSGVICAIGAIAGIIFGVRQWKRKDPGQRAVRDLGSWFCGLSRTYDRSETSMELPERNKRSNDSQRSGDSRTEWRVEEV